MTKNISDLNIWTNISLYIISSTLKYCLWLIIEIYIYIDIYSRVNYKLPIYVLVRYYFATYGLKNVTLPT